MYHEALAGNTPGLSPGIAGLCPVRYALKGGVPGIGHDRRFANGSSITGLPRDGFVRRAWRTQTMIWAMTWACSCALAAQVKMCPGEHGGFVCTTPAYRRAGLDAGGNLTSLRRRPHGVPGTAGGFVHAGHFVRLKTMQQTGPDAVAAEGKRRARARRPRSASTIVSSRTASSWSSGRSSLALAASPGRLRLPWRRCATP